MSHTPPVDSKGAAIDEIDKIIEFYKSIAQTGTNDKPNRDDWLKQAILALLAQEVKRVIGEDEQIPVGELMKNGEIKVGTPAHKGKMTIIMAQNQLRAEQRRKAGLV